MGWVVILVLAVAVMAVLLPWRGARNRRKWRAEMNEAVASKEAEKEAAEDSGDGE